MTLPPGTPPYQPGPAYQPGQPPSWQPLDAAAVPAQYPPGAPAPGAPAPSGGPYPAGAPYQAPGPVYPPPGVYPFAGQPGVPGPATYRVPPQPRGKITVGRVIGALALVWGLSFLVTVVLHWPIDDRLFPWVYGGDYQHYSQFRAALVNWLEYTLPLVVGGGLALTLLRPGVVRAVVGVAFAGLSAIVELVIIPAYFRHHGGIALPALLYALSATALAVAWLVVRGRSPLKVLLALVALPVAWLLQYLLQKALVDSITSDSHSLYDFLLRLHATVLALAYYLLVAVAIALAAWLAAIGGSSRPAGFGTPQPAFAGAPGPYPTPPGSLPPAPGSYPGAPPAQPAFPPAAQPAFPPAAQPGYLGGPPAQAQPGFPTAPPAQPGYPAGPGYGPGQPGTASGPVAPPPGG